MKKSSNESKNERHEAVKATMVVVLKRYFLVPCLLYVFNMIGSFFSFILDDNLEVNNNGILETLATLCLNIIWGFLLTALIIVLCIVLMLGFYGLISYLKKRTLISDLLEFLYEMKECCVSLIDDIIRFPKRIYNRIREEPKLFREAVKKQQTKQSEKENNETA